jgi:chromosome segregation ATPase
MIFDITTASQALVGIAAAVPLVILIWSKMNRQVAADSGARYGIQSDSKRIADLHKALHDKDDQIQKAITRLEEKDKLVYQLVNEKAALAASMAHMESELKTALRRIDHLSKMVKYLVERSGNNIPPELLLDLES